MLGKRIINATSGVACTTDTVQILDGVPFDSIATYELESDATNSVDTGYIGKSAIFSGSSSYISTSLSSSGINAMSFWLYFESGTTQGTPFGTDVGSGAGDLVTELGTNGSFSMTIQNKTYSAGAGALGSTGWKHIAYSSNQTLYINGVLQTGGTTITNSNPSANLLMGGWRYPVPSWGGFNSKIDQLRVYNTALTAGNVATLYAETASSTISISGLQAYYKFEGDATDETGNYDGTATNITYNEYDGTASNVTYATGKFGNAAVFNGSSSVIRDIPNSISTSLKSNNAFTYSFWIKLNSLGSQSIIAFFNDATSTVIFNGTNFEAYIYNSSAQQKVVVNSATVTTGVWYNVVFKGDSNGIFLYVNNNTPASTSWGGDWFIYTNSTYKYNAIGARQNSGGFTDYVDGLIDQVRIYDKALSAANVATLYAETLATSQTNISLNAPSGVAYYKMNDATDETGSYDGTATNVNFNVAGKFGNAGEFNGSSSNISLPTSIKPADSIMSISLWASNNATTRKDIFFLEYNNAPAFLALENNLYTDSTALGVYYNNAIVITAPNETLPPDGSWHHLVVTASATEVKLYKNGSQIGSTASVTVNTSALTEAHIGVRHYNNDLYWDGKIDQVRIFDRAITANEVTTLYNEVQCIPTIVPTDHFEPVIWDGAVGSGSRDFSGVGFQPDLVWAKRTSSGDDHHIYDSVRGAGATKVLASNKTAAEPANNAATYGYLDAFLPDGFSTVSGSANNAFFNENNQSFVSWNWKAGGAAVSNTDGTIDSQVSANVDAGFSIVTFTSPSTTNQIFGIGHGLTNTPKVIITKERDGVLDWITYHESLGTGAFLRLNTTDASGTFPTQVWGDTAPNDSTFELKTSISVNTNKQLVAYCFAEVEGYSKLGSYTGTAGSNSIVTGFRPAFVMIKSTNQTGSRWIMVDNKRGDGGLNVAKILNAQDSIAEFTASSYGINFHSNGFSIPAGTSGNINSANNSYIFMAFAEENVQPEPELANSFNVVAYTGNGTDITVNTGLKPDMVWIKERTSTSSHRIVDSVRGDKKRIFTNVTNAESEVAAGEVLLDNGFQVGADNGSNQNGEDYVAWAWKASNDSTINQEGSTTSIVSANPAAGFSVVKYTGGGDVNVGHGLSSAPDLIISKITNVAGSWVVYNSISGTGKYLVLNDTASIATASEVFSAVTDTTFTHNWSGNSYSYISYCFHSVDGHQKVGSYTGTGATGNVVTTGFRPKWILAKKITTDSSYNHWMMLDSIRSSSGSLDDFLYANLSNSESAQSTNAGVTLQSDGFTPYGGMNNTVEYIYLAIA